MSTDEPLPLIYCVGTQVVAQKNVMAANDQIAHPSGAVGVIVRSPADRTHAYRVKFADGFEALIHHEQLMRLADFISKTERGTIRRDSKSIVRASAFGDDSLWDRDLKGERLMVPICSFTNKNTRD